ncbi:ABC transporter substrate binding protein [Salinisphaera shabanensis E1L3A]|uniref:ABC transporter substrate binding protein n=1 Tax=Salinisphaera shabanensis E1L3A TaxID=1033802 RepID=U2FZT4_9GAMM|nr:ABC transporter substrate-binding protein [Salinisphaera shabanensis]ERJ19588.1 ABC transporter substrate binding protein [Salinisphaera shabanensis E1L3A]
MRTRPWLTHAVAALLLACTPLMFAGTASAQQTTTIRIVLNWKYEGPQAWFFLAKQRGYFADQGLNVILDQGSGSSAAVSQVATGAYDAGFGDVNTLIEFAAKSPDDHPYAVYQIYNQPPFTIAVNANSDIKTPADLEGKTIAGPANDGALKLFPAFAKITGIDASKIDILNIEPRLREQMLIRERVDGVFGYVNTIRFSAMLAGIDANKDFRFIRYGDYGMDLYSNAIIVSKELVENNPDAVRGLVTAINHAIADTLADIDTGIDAVMQREPLLNRDVETKRLLATLRDEIDFDNMGDLGLGNIDEQRFAKAIDIVVDAKDLERTPTVDEIFDTRFLPPKNKRIYTLDYEAP